MHSNHYNSSRSMFSLKDLHDYLDESDRGRERIFLVSCFGAMLTVIISWVTLRNISIYYDGFSELARMRKLFGIAYIVVGAIAALSVLLSSVRSHRWKIPAAVAYIVINIIDAGLLAAAGVIHFVYHIRHKGDAIDACMKVARKTVGSVNPLGNGFPNAPEPMSVLLKSCEQSYYIDKYAIIGIVVFTTLYFGVACIWTGIYYFKQLRDEENGAIKRTHQKDPVVYSEYYVGTNPFEHSNRK